MLTGKQTLRLFPTLVTTYQVEAPAMNQALAALVVERSRTVPSVPRGERVGWQSGDDFLSWSGEARALGKLLADAVMDAHAEVAALDGISLFGWANLFTRGVFFNPHTHGNAAWSGVYYVDAGDSGDAGGGMLMFRDPRAGAAMVLADSNHFDSGCAYQIAPRTGALVVFPSWLLHWVTPYQGDRPRISVSFNAR